MKERIVAVNIGASIYPCIVEDLNLPGLESLKNIESVLLSEGKCVSLREFIASEDV